MNEINNVSNRQQLPPLVNEPIKKTETEKQKPQTEPTNKVDKLV
jgi:hypothetical protein|tara:strand:- start:941 stop:1072 length:132 start_codon:yes stop_codon:yes gene_type:complete